MLGDYMEVEDDAPWENAVMLAEFGPDGEEDEEGATKEGDNEGASKARRSANTTELAERDVDYGLKLYCVDCGVQGMTRMKGTIEIGWLPPRVSKAEVTLNGNLYAGMFLGLEMFAEFTQEWEKDIVKEYLNPWNIPLVLEFGPYIRMGVEATFELKAQGTLLLGASATWDAIEAKMDLLNPSNSYQTGFTPTLVRKAEAEVELSAEATLGLPIGIGVGIEVFSLKSWDIELKDTPALVAEASFKASIDANDCSGPGCEEEEEEPEECEGGIEWSVGFRNTLAFAVTGFDDYELNVWDSPPFADGCINIFGGDDDGNDGDGDDGEDGGDGTDDGENDGSDDNGTCTPGELIPNPSTPAYAYCNFKGGIHNNRAQRLGKVIKDSDADSCAKKCLETSGCNSFGFNSAKSQCKLFSKKVIGLDFYRGGPNSKNVYSDASCYKLTTCPS
jgi:hypothetical protein